MSNIPLLAVLCGLSYLFYKYIVLPAFLSPLAKIPNAHFTASFSPLWILWKRYWGAENQAIHRAHLKYGPIVRTGPKDVNVNCVDGGIKTVYSGGFEKPNWYPNVFQNYDTMNMFSTKGSKEHSIRKRMVSNVYSKSYLQSSHELHSICDHIIYKRYIPTLEALAKERTAVDVHELNFAVTMDTINAYIFGLSNGSNFVQDVKTRRYILHEYMCRRPYGFFDQELPGLSTYLAYIGILTTPKWVEDATKAVELFCLNMCHAARASIESGLQLTPENTPTVYKHLSQSIIFGTTNSKPSNPRPNQDTHPLIASELLDQLAAGHETSGVTLTYAIYSLSQHAHMQAALRKELLALSPPIIYPASSQESLPTLPSPRSIDALPLLHAILMETLRLYAAIPGPQPRQTPYTPVSIAGSPPLPGGVRIAAQAYSLHRNAEVFPDPEAWRPERWTESSKEQKEEMGRWFWAFGSGGRMCVGSNFAIQEMKLVLAAIYSNYSTQLVDVTGIGMKDAYTSGPVGNQLTIRFEHA